MNQIKYPNSTVNTRDDEVHFVFHVNKYVFYIYVNKFTKNYK